MERPSKLTGEQGEYIQFLEKKLEVFNSKTTKVESYLTVKKIVDDTNKLVRNGVSINHSETGEFLKKVDIISEESLMSKDEKTFDRLSKFLDKIEEYNGMLDRFNEQLDPEDIKSVEKELLKGDDSVEGRIFRGKK